MAVGQDTAVGQEGQDVGVGPIQLQGVRVGLEVEVPDAGGVGQIPSASYMIQKRASKSKSITLGEEIT